MDLLKLRRLLDEGKNVLDLPLRAVYYARVSTEKDEQLHSLQNQVEYFESFLEKRPQWTSVGGYVDEGLSGTSVEKRTHFLRMIEDARAGLFDLIVTKEISRFSRNTLDSIRFTQELLRYGVGVFFEADNICTFAPDAELRLTIMASLAQDEVRRTSERVKFGFRRSMEKGRVLGADNTPGYRKKDGVLTVEPKEAEFVRRVFHEYVGGTHGLRRLAVKLSEEGFTDRHGRVYSYASLRNIITNPKYKGHYCGRKYQTLDYRSHKVVRLDPSDWVTGRDERIPALVSEALWDEANRLLRTRGAVMKQHTRAVQSRYPFSGKLVCGTHGDSYHRIVVKSGSGQREGWVCRRYRLYGREKGCDSPILYSDELYAILAEVVSQLQLNRERIINELLVLYETYAEESDETGRLETLCAVLSTLERKKDKLLELYIETLITKEEFAARNDKMEEERRRVSSEIEKLETLKQRRHQEQDELSSLRETLTFLWDEAQTGGLFAKLLRRAVVRKTEDANRLQLELTLETGQRWLSELSHHKGKPSSHFLLYSETGISEYKMQKRFQRGRGGGNRELTYDIVLRWCG